MIDAEHRVNLAHKRIDELTAENDRLRGELAEATSLMARMLMMAKQYRETTLFKVAKDFVLRMTSEETQCGCDCCEAHRQYRYAGNCCPHGLTHGGFCICGGKVYSASAPASPAPGGEATGYAYEEAARDPAFMADMAALSDAPAPEAVDRGAYDVEGLEAEDFIPPGCPMCAEKDSRLAALDDLLAKHNCGTLADLDRYIAAHEGDGQRLAALERDREAAEQVFADHKAIITALRTRVEQAVAALREHLPHRAHCDTALGAGRGCTCDREERLAALTTLRAPSGDEAALEDAHKALDFAKAPRNCFDNPPVPFTLAGRINALHGQLASLRLHAEEQRKMLALRTLERDDARAALTTLRVLSGKVPEKEEKCPSCGGVLRVVDSRSEPEGVRSDRRCERCHGLFMTTKAGFVRIRW